MVATAARQWWVLVVQGILGVLFGIFAILNPGATLVTLALIFGAWAIISGVSSIAEGWRVAESRGRSWPFAASGIVSIVAGVLAVLVPPAAIGGLILFLGAWLVVAGVMEAYAAYRIRDEISNEWIIAIAGIARAVLGLIILAVPIVGVILTVTTIAYVAIAAGVMAIALGWRLRHLHQTVGGARDRLSAA